MYKLIVIAVGLFQIANAVYVESKPSCVKGPTYWCKSIQSSIECNAFNHCLQTVWTKHTSYLNEDSQMVNSQLHTANPNKCSNCLQCFETNSMYRCPVIRSYQNEVQQLVQNKMPSSSICRLLTQCGEQTEQQAQNSNDKEALGEGEGKVDDRFECGLHPRHWCDNLHTAERCFTFEQCMMKWTQSSFKYVIKQDQKFTSSLSAAEVSEQKTCGYCIFIFNKLHEILEQNDTEIDMEVFLKGACALLPDQKQTQMCNDAVQKFTPEIYVMLRNNMDPGIICRVLGMCQDKYLTGVTIHDEIKEKEMKKEEEERNAAMEIKRILSNMKIRVINEDEAIIKTPLQEAKSKQHLLGSKDEELVAELKSTMGVGCELCEIVLTAAKHMINNKIDDKKVLSFINKELCSRMGSLKQTCNDYVNLEGEQIIDLLKKAVDPALICQMMGFCLKIQVNQLTNGETKFYDLNVRDSVNCTLCKMVFTQVKRMISNEVEQQKIVNYINTNLCAKVGRSKELCHTLIDAYGPLFLEIIARDVNPGQLCEMIGMCSQADMNEEIPSIEIDQILAEHVKKDQLQSNDSCVICEFVLKLLGEFVSQNSTEPEVEKLLEYVCQKVMPVPIRDECSAFVAQYGPVVIALLVNGIQPDKICTFIGLCPKQTQIHQNVQQQIRPVYNFLDEEHLFKHRTMELAREQSIQAQLKCTSCRFAIQYLSKQSNVDSAVESTCQYSPDPYREHCDALVAAHGFQLADLIAKYQDVDRVCGAIQMCTQSDDEPTIDKQKPELEVIAVGMIELEPAKKIEKVDTKNNTVECSLCIYVAELVDSLLNQNKTEDEITKELETVCNLFPSQLKDQCVAFLNEYGPYVIQLVAAKLDPESTCAALKLCQKSILNDILRNRF